MKIFFKILAIMFVVFFSNNVVVATDAIVMNSQKEELNIQGFIKETEKYTKNVLGDTNVNDIFTSALTGKVDNKGFFYKILSVFGSEVKETITMLGLILIIIIIHSILKSVTDGLENKNVSQITYYVQYIMIVTLIMNNFVSVINIIKESIQNLVGFSNNLIPILVTLMLTTGCISSATVIEPVLLLIITFIGNVVLDFLLPLVLVATALSVISKVSDKVQIDKISKFMKSSVVWVLGIVLTLFVSVVSLEGSLTSGVDGITAKTAKAAVSNVIPVVGKILGDAVDTVIGCSNILKNAVGLVGVIVIICICIMPIAKLTILSFSYKLTSAVCEPLADKNIVSLLDQVGDTFKILLAVMVSVSVMLLIGITLVLKISNSALMYR